MLGLLGDEWSLLILQQALLGATRYGEFLSRLPISNAVLTGRLRALTEDLLLERVAYQTIRSSRVPADRPQPVTVADLLSIWKWERPGWSTTDRLPSMSHHDCGHDFTPTLVCAGA